MKRLIFLLTLLTYIFTFSYALESEDLSKYKLMEYNSVEEFQQAYLNNVIAYFPKERIHTIHHYTELDEQMGLGKKLRLFIVVKITGKTKKNKDSQDMEWTIKEVNGNTTKTFIIHTGNYNKKISQNEYMFKDLQFYSLDKWKEDHKSEIGKIFENPMVKANYEVIDLYLTVGKEYDSLFGDGQILKMYTVRNTISGQKFDYIAEKTGYLCFRDDLSGKYVSTLAKVEKPSNPSVKYGKTTIVKDEGITKYSYEDNYISVIIFGTSQQFCFTMKNVSDYSLKIVWDDAVFVDYSGSTSKVMHSGIKYSQKEASQSASTIIKGASLDDIACPTNNVYYNDVLKEWTTLSMYPKEVSMETKQVQLMLPIQIKDIVNEYIFVFDINYKYNHPERLNLPE